MKLTFDIDPDQAVAIYREECRKRTLVDIESALPKCLTSKITLTDEEFERAVDYALEIQENEIDYINIAERAVRRVLKEKMETQEEPKFPIIYRGTKRDLDKKPNVQEGSILLIEDRVFIFYKGKWWESDLWQTESRSQECIDKLTYKEAKSE